MIMSFTVKLAVLGLCAVLCASSPVHSDDSLAAPSLKNLMENYLNQSATWEAIISLPYGHINEPVRWYYDPVNDRSRTEYYEGKDVYIFTGPNKEAKYGMLQQIVPVVKTKECFQTNGTPDYPTVIQAGFPPDLDSYLPMGSTTMRGIPCIAFQKLDMEDGRSNNYTLYLSEVTNQPIFFSMIGYDYVFGSHYDVYTIDYLSYIPGPLNASIFQPSMKCGDFPGPGLASRGGLSILERTSAKAEDQYVESHFANFTKTHNKKYKHEEERRQRKNHFRHNHRFIESHNRKGLSYTVGLNQFADWSEEEMKVMRGSRSSRKTSGPATTKLNALQYKDWRNTGYVTYVKDQGICGSCWSFGAAEALEGQYYAKYNESTPLSQQALMDCSWNFGNNACDGGEAFRAYEWVMEAGGLPSQFDYGKYTMADGFCHLDNLTRVAKISGYHNISDPDTLYQHVLNDGPVAVAIDASRPTFTFYKSGIYFDPDCGNTPADLDHAVLAVGINNPSGDALYWIVKNSWSTNWGENGYVYMSTADNNCGVATDAHLPIVV